MRILGFAAFPTILFNENTHILMVFGDNFSEWKDKVLLTLVCMDMNLTIREDKPPIPMEWRTPEDKVAYELWERSNRLCLIFIRVHMNQSIMDSIPECKTAKAYMESIDAKCVSSKKTLASTLVKKLSCTMLDKGKSMCEHIMEMRDIATKLKSLEVDISESFLMHFILNSLLTEYGPFKISYNI